MVEISWDRCSVIPSEAQRGNSRRISQHLSLDHTWPIIPIPEKHPHVIAFLSFNCGMSHRIAGRSKSKIEAGNIGGKKEQQIVMPLEIGWKNMDALLRNHHPRMIIFHFTFDWWMIILLRSDFHQSLCLCILLDFHKTLGPWTPLWLCANILKSSTFL